MCLRLAASGEAEILAGLFQLYRHDLSEYSGQDIGQDAAFDDRNLGRYLLPARYCAYLFHVGDQLAGFALVDLESNHVENETVSNLDDFFILRRWRRQGVGTEAATLLLSSRPGRWQINKRTYNPVAMNFWNRVVESVATGEIREHVTEGDIHMHIFRVP